MKDFSCVTASSGDTSCKLSVLSRISSKIETIYV